MESNTVLITGGATGIGLALAKEFISFGNEVIICGRRKNKLDEAKRSFPNIHIKLCDVSSFNDRQELYNWVKTNFKKLNILVNNAGIQKMIDFKKGISEFKNKGNEISINFEAPVLLSAYFVPLLLNQKEAAIINISSGLGFIPLAIMPVYCASKAAIHSFSISLRHQLKETSIKVFEIIPPIVDTELDRGTRDKKGGTYKGISPEETAKETMIALKKDEYEFAIGTAQNLRMGSRQNPEGFFANMNH
jgi:uncharacterized oxidoreductase